MRRSLWEACRRVGIDGRDAQLLRFRRNAVFFLPYAQLAARVTFEPRARVQAEWRLLRFLDAAGVRAPRVVCEPVSCGSATVLLTRWEERADAPVRWERAGEVAAAAHEALGGWRGPLPGGRIDLIGQAQDRLRRLADRWPDPADVALLGAHLKRLNGSALSNSPLGEGVVHGDLHADNLLVSARGLVLLDWELAGIAPREWDFAAVGCAQRFFGQEGAVDAFAAGYGRDPGEVVWELVELRALLITAGQMLAAHTPAARTQAKRRLAYWRTGRLDQPWDAG